MSVPNNNTESNNQQTINRLLTGNDVAKILSVSRTHAYHLIRHGYIPSIRLGRSVRVRQEDLVRFISDNVNTGGKKDQMNPINK